MDDVAGEEAPVDTVGLLGTNSVACGFKQWLPLIAEEVEGATDDVGPTTETIVG